MKKVFIRLKLAGFAVLLASSIVACTQVESESPLQAEATDQIQSEMAEEEGLINARLEPGSIRIGSQIWMDKNLDGTHYRNGDPLIHATTPEEWIAANTAGEGAWAYYDYDPANGEIYGKLYNWYAVNDPRGLAPEGWHVPSPLEVSKLRGTVQYNGGKLKSTGTLEAGTGLWQSPNTGATNKSNFTALPGGFCDDAFGAFYGQGIVANFWTNTDSDVLANAYSLQHDDTNIGGGLVHKGRGHSVRLIKD